jgi:hypothetical protein
LLLQAGAIAQTAHQQSVRANIDSFGVNYTPERVYIQFDKPGYAQGETIWFKAYLMKGFDISGLSKTLYLDFTDDNGNVLTHGVYPVWDASAAGNFDISADYAGKSIHVRATTKWMLNFDSAFEYNKDIRIVAKPAAGSNTAFKQQVPVATVQFFPEGGDCIVGVKTKIAFKANYQNRLPANITGIVTDSKGNTVDTIKTVHDGMGFFYLEAQAGETYTAKWSENNGTTTHQTPLPAAKPVGASIEISPRPLRTGFIVTLSDNAPDAMKQMHLVATMQQRVVYMAAVNLSESPVTGGNIPTTQFASGIMKLTLFDANWIPVAERISFVDNNDYHFEPKVSFDSLSTVKRGENVLLVDVPDSLESNLSVSVTDAGLGVDSSDDIISHLLLTGELKGQVYHPGYYFSKVNDSAAKYLDLVMLTNGWRRYKWEDIIAGQRPTIKYPADKDYLNFSGQVFGATPKQLKDAGGIAAFISPKGKDSSRQFLTIPINSDGSFSKPGLIFFDTLKVYYQFISKSGTGLNSTAEVNFNSSGIPARHIIAFDKTSLGYSVSDTTGNYRYSILVAEEARLRELLKSTTLKGVTVTTKAKSRLQVMDEKYTNGLFTGGYTAAQFDVVNDQMANAAPDVFSYLRGRVSGLAINNTAVGTVSVMYRGAPISLFVDEIPTDVNSVSYLNMNDVAYIKVLPPPFFGGFGPNGNGSGGAIAIYTRRGDDAQNNPNSRSLQYKLVAGYTLAKEFYSPDYGDLNQANSQEDVRSTLYWNPLVITTPKSHVAKLRFYNNDITTQLRVVLEGVSRDGKFTRVEKIAN